MTVIGFRRLVPHAVAPRRAHATDAGYDVCSAVSVTLWPGEFAVVSTGVTLDIPPGWEVQVRPRSGLAAKHGVTVLNAPGTIDAGYLGEVGVVLINHGSKEFKVVPGDRIAQLVPARLPEAELVEAIGEPQQSERGNGGFGSSDV